MGKYTVVKVIITVKINPIKTTVSTPKNRVIARIITRQALIVSAIISSSFLGNRSARIPPIGPMIIVGIKLMETIVEKIVAEPVKSKICSAIAKLRIPLHKSPTIWVNNIILKSLLFIKILLNQTVVINIITHFKIKANENNR